MVLSIPPAPTVQVLQAGNSLGPRTVVTLDGLTGDSFTLIRISGGETNVVRDGNRKTHAGTAVVVDYEAPAGSAIYRARCSDETGDSGWSDSVTAQVDFAIDEAWLSDPLVPENVLRVALTGDALESVGRDPDVEVLDTIGTSKHPAQFFGLKPLDSVPLNIRTMTDDDATMLETLLASAPLLLRTADDNIYRMIPRLFYCALSAKDTWQGYEEWHEWAVTGQEVAPQTISVVLKPVTIQTYMDAYAKISNVMAAYSTISDEMLNPPGGY